MPRLKLTIPDAVVFETRIPLRISDMNYGNHLGNDAVMSIMHEARVQFLRSLGYSELDIEGVGIIMSDAHIVFRGEGFYGDVITARLSVSPPEGVRFDLYYRLLNAETGKEIARARTELCFFNYRERKTTAAPEAFAQRIRNL